MRSFLLLSAIMSFAACVPNLSTDASGTMDVTSDADAASDTAVDVESGPTAMAACSAFASAYCARFAACTSNFESTVIYGPMASQCTSVIQADCVAALTAPGNMTPTSARMACAAEIPMLDCVSVIERFAGSSACAWTPGRLATGATCYSDSQCASGACSFAGGTGCGTCIDVVVDGMACGPTAQCASGSLCFNGMCVARAHAGQSCDANHPCDVFSSCAMPAGGVGTCQVLSDTAGSACGSASPSMAGCNNLKGLYCNGTMCAVIQLATLGQPCTLGGGMTECTGPSRCTLVMGQSTCAMPSADGQPCAPRTGPFCASPGVCVIPSSGGSGMCITPNATNCPAM